MSSGGSKTQKTTSKSTSTPTQSDQYGNLLEAADQWLEGGGLDPYYGGSNNFNQVATLTDSQKQGIQGMTGTGQALSSLYNSAGVDSVSNFLGAYDPEKTGLNKAIGAANEQMLYDFDTGQAAQLRTDAQNAGQFGSSRAGIAEGLARSRLNQNMANNASQLAYQDQQQYNQNQLSAINNLTAITKGLSSGDGLQYDSGALEQQQNQQQLLGQLDKWAYENNVDLNNLAAYKQLITGDMGGVNVSNGTSSGGGGGGLSTALGAIGGVAAGSFFGNIGGNIGGNLGSSLGAGILGG